MSHNIWIYLLVMAAVSYLIRMTPLALIRREITNKYLRSFLFYVPYATLAVMTLPPFIVSTPNPIGGILALLVGIFVRLQGCMLF